MQRLAILVAIAACGSKPPPQPPLTPGSNAPPVKPPDPPPTPPVAAVPHDPEWFEPAWKKVGVGQTISFGVPVIDQDLDETRVTVTRMPATATFDAITQTVTWTPAKADQPRATFEVAIEQRGATMTKSFEIAVEPKPQPVPTAPVEAPVIETLLMIREPARLAQVNQDWPLDKLLEVGAATFKLQIPEERRAKIAKSPDGKTAYEQMLAGLAQTHGNPRLDPKDPKFDKAAFGDPRSWQIVAFRPRIDKAWTELRVVYRAMKAPEPVFAMFRLRPVVEYVPALPRPGEEREANNKLFLGMVAKHLLASGAPNGKFVKDTAAHGKAVSALMTELMTFDDTKTKPYLHGFEIGIALEARMGGGSARNADGSYKSGDGWGWSAMKPFQTADQTGQAYVNVAIPGFWTKTVPSPDNSTWIPTCAPRFSGDDPKHAPGYEILCRKTMGFVDLPDTADGKPVQGKRDAVNLYIEHKQKYAQELLPLDDGRRDLGEENGMTCAQCHIRNFGMHDYGDLANVDPSKGTPKAPNHRLATLVFQIVPGAYWEPFTLEFLQHQECRGKQLFEQYLGASSLSCPLAK
jgi:hypothetical protein